jgi:hypothetical protein
MRMVVCALVVVFSFALPAQAQDNALERAAGAELNRMCREDAGQLWRIDLCGPLIVVNAQTRAVWAARADEGGVLRRAGDGWVGVLPQGVPIANTTVDWSGVQWVMVVGPLPQDTTQRRVLVAHEAWHRIQAPIRLPQQPSSCPHLESERGRYFLRLEMRALATALRSRSSARRRAAQDALRFRAARQATFPGAEAQEDALDRNEGLAYYTGVRLGAEEPDFFAARTLDQYDEHEAFARAYAYATGPAYGLLLDNFVEAWRERLGGFAPADMLAATLGVGAPADRQLRRMAERYGGPAIAAEERARAEAQRVLIASLRQRFGQGPRLELPLSQVQFEFDPERVTPVEGLGSVYARLTLRDRWGELVATEGALIDPTFTRLTTAAPTPSGLSGPGWRLRLNPGYGVAGPDGTGVSRVVLLVQE